MYTTPAVNLSEVQLVSNHTSSDKIELQALDLPQNYSILINKLEQLALGLDSAFANLTFDRKEFDVTSINGIVGSNDGTENELVVDLLSGAANGVAMHTPPLSADSVNTYRGLSEAEYSRVVSDIWIGVILTLLIVSVIFFICSCFLYHKFQQWKNSYRTNHNDPVEICRHYPADFEAESLPSYTIVSGLPTYDDALEEFRKAGIILAPSALPVIKIFESDTKDNQLYNLESGFNEPLATNIMPNSGDNISVGSTCTCGAGRGSVNSLNNSTTSLRSALNLSASTTPLTAAQVIELTPEQLAMLSRKRLSLQIAFNNPVTYRRNSRPRIDLYRTVNRNNLLRSYAAAGVGTNTATVGGVNLNANGIMTSTLPPIHRSTSSTSILSNEQRQPQQHYLHRGSLF